MTIPPNRPRPCSTRARPRGRRVGHFLGGGADLVGVEVVVPSALFRVFGVVVDAGQWGVAAGLVNVEAAAVGVLFLEQEQALPEEAGVLGLLVLGDLFADASTDSIVLETDLAAQGGALPGLGVNEAVFTAVVEALHCAADAGFFAEVAPGVVTRMRLSGRLSNCHLPLPLRLPWRLSLLT